MEMTSLVDMLIGLVVAGSAWWINTMSKEQKRLEILLNKTREEYATKMELNHDINRVIETLHRVEDKLDKILSNRLK